MNETEDFQSPHCTLCGAEMPAHTKPWQLWCSSCKTEGLRHLNPALVFGIVLAGLAVWLSASPLAAALAAGLILALTVASVVDANLKLLPDDIVQPLLWAGLLANLVGFLVPLQQAVLGAVAGFMALWALYWIAYLASGNEAFGYGDIKLVAALGAWLGWDALPAILVGGAMVHTLVSLAFRMGGRPSTTLPFGPALAVAGISTLMGLLSPI